MWRRAMVVAVALVAVARAQFEEEDKEYMGKEIGLLNSYHHQVNGKVYAVDANTLLLKNFVYDGNGKDTFFWAGSSNRPGSKGFIVPDRNGKTNVLGKYNTEEFTLKLPSQKKVNDIKWFSVFDISTQNNFGDVYIPPQFVPPGYQTLPKLEGDTNSILSDQVVVMDSKTIKIPALTYDGEGGQVFFFAGEGPQPSSRGFIVPDELGYLAPLGVYKEKDVIIQLPGDKTIFTIDWLAIYDKANEKYLAYIIIPPNLNVPPSLVTVMPHNPGLPNCVMLHKNMMVAWESFPPQLTVQLAGFIGDDEYMAFGLSGTQGENSMQGGDVALVYMDEFLGHVEDYNLTARSVCHKVLGVDGGACSDEVMQGINSHQLASASRENGVTAVTYRTTFSNLGDGGDLEIPTSGPVSVIWSIGKISERAHRTKEPSFHHTYSKMHTQIDFGRAEQYDSCFPFTSDRKEVTTPWSIPPIFDPTRRSFSARLGPAGGRRGFSGKTGLPSSSLVWYIEGLMVPELYLRRGLTYSFKIEGGSNPRSTEYYHPFIITDEPVGGYDRLTDFQKSKVRVLAGVQFTWRGAVRPTSAGRLCIWTHRRGGDRRRDDEFNSFERFRNSLQIGCEDGEPAILEVTPNVTWPDVVYYHSYTTPYMGWKIHIVDSFRRKPSFGSAPAPTVSLILLLAVPLFFLT
eukprot:TRINITY_DN23239_c0_g1_i1.p1 TRINITY_DN23239_c0_g1~~TRINITY_DN23239_c0_g1_i1.p1  ORF type:complete len:682 (+),score=132.87 TRINITY_DN23239_c0_g1_i1:69-2114(+)